MNVDDDVVRQELEESLSRSIGSSSVLHTFTFRTWIVASGELIEIVVKAESKTQGLEKVKEIMGKMGLAFQNTKLVRIEE